MLRFMRKVVTASAVLCSAFFLSGCANAQISSDGELDALKITESAEEETIPVDSEEEEETLKMNIQIGDSVFAVTLEGNEAVNALIEMMKVAPVVIEMSDYAGFEKVGPLGTGLPTSDSYTTTQAGDIVLYNGNQIVIFYGSNSWSYTRLGHVDDLTGWEDALGTADVTVTFSLD